ncbi:hypothetical protein LSAT2_013153 [Lamellibrachia satsuma]|nr:hypothetical protein LSAT2_013153 [Lamellibrachia satsuma]
MVEIEDTRNILKVTQPPSSQYTIYAQDILSLAQMIQKKIDLILPPQHATYFTRMLHMFKQLDISIKHFQNVLKSKHKFYMNVYNLFTASHEIAQWYSETLSLLPTYLLRYDMNSDTGHPLVTVLHAWKNATDHHQKHHPIPHKNQLETLRDTVRLIADMTVHKQIRLLLYRTELLHKVLTWPELVTQKEVEDILRWKCMVESSSDEVSLLLVSQSFTFTNKEKPANEDSSDRQHSRTPKLRSQGYISDSDIDLFVSMRKQDTKEVCPIEQSKSGISLAKHHYPRIKSCISDDVSHDGDSALTRAEC